MEYEVVARLNIDAVLAALADAGGPHVAPVRLLPGGEVGAWEVVRANGARSVLTWRPPRHGYDGAAQATRTAELVAIARRGGMPAPDYEDVVPLPDGGVAVLQQYVDGVCGEPAADLVGVLLQLAECRRGLLRGTRFANDAAPLYLLEDGPGFCLHGPLRDHDRRTRRLLDWIEAVGQADANAVMGDDLVHFDYHLGNVLTDPQDESRVVGILDWDGATSGDVALDGVTLALDLILCDADEMVVDQIVDHLTNTTPEKELRPLWAHGLLRLVDWRLRHAPQDDLSWLPRAERVAGI